MAKDIMEIRNDYNAGVYRCNMPTMFKLPENHVFDEELSVRANREMVVAHNEKVDKQNQEKRETQARLYAQLTQDVVDYIHDTYDVSVAQAQLIQAFAYEEKHSFMNDYFNYIDEVASFAESILEAKAD